MAIHRTAVDEGPAYGAALLAGVASGLFNSVREACSVVRVRDEVTEPNHELSRRYEAYYEVYNHLYAANATAMKRLSELVAGE